MFAPPWTYVAALGFMCLLCAMVGFAIYGWNQFAAGWQERDSTKAWTGVVLFVAVFLAIIYFTRMHLNWPADYKEPEQPTPQVIIITATPTPTVTPEF